jgi:hypothetical protein
LYLSLRGSLQEFYLLHPSSGQSFTWWAETESAQSLNEKKKFRTGVRNGVKGRRKKKVILDIKKKKKKRKFAEHRGLVMSLL